MRRLRIQIPAVVIELRLVRHHLHADGRPLLHPQKSDHHVRHLHARIVDIVLNLHPVPRVPQNPHHRVAQHRIPHMPNVPPGQNKHSNTRPQPPLPSRFPQPSRIHSQSLAQSSAAPSSIFSPT